jgi:hypothetical protein
MSMFFSANGNWKCKSVFSSQQTISDNWQLLFQQTCPSIVKSGVWLDRWESRVVMLTIFWVPDYFLQNQLVSCNIVDTIICCDDDHHLLNNIHIWGKGANAKGF